MVEEGFANGDTVITLTYPKPFPRFDPTPRLPIRLLEADLPVWKHRDRMSVDKLLGNFGCTGGRAGGGTSSGCCSPSTLHHGSTLGFRCDAPYSSVTTVSSAGVKAAAILSA